MRKIISCLMAFLAIANANAISEVKIYPTADYGLELKDVYQFNGKFNSNYCDALVDEEGNFYFLTSYTYETVSLHDGTKIDGKQALLKMNPAGNVVWMKSIGTCAVQKIAIFDGHLFLPVFNPFYSSYAEYDGVKYEATTESSYFLLKVDKENGSVVNHIEIEKDNFVEDGFDPFYGSSPCGFTFSPEGDLWFMFDINEDYDRVNKDYPVSFERHGNNDKCLFVLSKDLEIKKVYCLGSEKNDEVNFENDYSIASYMTFAGDTLFMYIPFWAKNVMSA